MAERSVIPIEENQHSLVAKICNPWTWRLANVVMALFFALAAFVQVSIKICLLTYFLLRFKSGKLQ